ncbi:ArsR/SmtB family transcription factor [Paraburkholderia phosphatilytica]|uniref:ArsR/SmtB family transcription factor n=1 Tax=Paraburkholderia phosphatilytica TaxID=2282883 RepID=UPI000E4F5133|nr:helix-turn-helix domain-containing protein [Paraburkholderia phosphatilytica]
MLDSAHSFPAEPNVAIDEDRIHKALANPFRRKILAWLKTPHETFAQGHIDFRHGVPVNAIQARCGLSQSTVSAHISTLLGAGLVVSTRVGQWILLSRNEAVIAAFASQIGSRL